jgi:glycosyltransferase involved in cell wall biosynthesis
MRVALLSFDFGEYCIRLARGLAREAEVLLLLADSEMTPERRRLLEGSPPALVVELLAKPRLRQIVRQVRTARWLARRVEIFAPDVVHLQRGHPAFALALPSLRPRPLVVTVHDALHHLGDRESRRMPQVLEDIVPRSADHVIVHAEAVRISVVERLNRARESVHVVPHVRLGDHRDAPATAEEDGLVLFFGRIWPYKGLEYLIQAEPEVSSRVPQARFLIAGQGESLDRYRRLMAHPERFAAINEFVSDRQRAELFRRASVIALPYVEASQSGVVPLAYTFEKPVVATSVGGLPEMIEDGVTGFIVPPRDASALAAALVRLLRDPILRRQFGSSGRLRLEREWSEQAVAARTLEIYRTAIERRPPLRHKKDDLRLRQE